METSDHNTKEPCVWAATEEANDLSNPDEVPKVTLKLILLGDSSVGKSCIVFRYIYGIFKAVTELTIGVNFVIKPVTLDNDQKVLINVCDSAGQEQFHSVTTMYLRGAQIALVVYDITNRNSFIKANDWINDLYSAVGKENVTIFLVGNKSDLAGQRRQISYETAKKYSIEHGFKFMEVSAKTGKNINEMFTEAVKEAVKEHPEWMLPQDQEGSNVIDLETHSNIENSDKKPEQHRKCCK